MAVVLIVDDSPTELHLFQKMLEKDGFDTLVADSGEEGLRKAKNSKPDCILMDVVMPGMNGFQATRRLTQDADTASNPVIMITTKDQETDREWGMRQVAKGYLVKPVDSGELLHQIDELLR